MRNIDPSLIALLDEVRKTYESIPERYRKEMPTRILVRVLAGLIPGVTAVDGSAPGSDLHTWLGIDGEDRFIIDVLPTHIFPGPVALDVRPGRSTDSPYKDSYAINMRLTKDNDKGYKVTVDEIVDATEGARRFLSMP